MKLLVAVAILLGITVSAKAHDQWGNGEPVPAWVKKYCCGPEDVHHLTDKQVSVQPDGYHIVGTPLIVPFKEALPSPDGSTWAFFKVTKNPDGTQSFSPIYCFFYPPQSF